MCVRESTGIIIGCARPSLPVAARGECLPVPDETLTEREERGERGLATCVLGTTRGLSRSGGVGRPLVLPLRDAGRGYCLQVGGPASSPITIRLQQIRSDQITSGVRVRIRRHYYGDSDPAYVPEPGHRGVYVYTYSEYARGVVVRPARRRARGGEREGHTQHSSVTSLAAVSIGLPARARRVVVPCTCRGPVAASGGEEGAGTGTGTGAGRRATRRHDLSASVSPPPPSFPPAPCSPLSPEIFTRFVGLEL